MFWFRSPSIFRAFFIGTFYTFSPWECDIIIYVFVDKGIFFYFVCIKIYFKYTVVAKDKWIIRAALNKPLDLAKTSYCRGKSNSFISIYTENFVLLNTVSCAVNLTHEFAESGTYILHMSYPVDYNGSFSLASMRR